MRAVSFRFLVCLIFSFSVSSLWAQEWAYDLQSILSEYLACSPEMTDDGPCNVFVARALKRVYGVDDFLNPGNKNKAAKLANEIYDYVSISPRWVLIGDALSETALEQAAQKANSGVAVIAVMRGEPNGHVSLVLPGPLTTSATWGMKVPNSASFFVRHPEKAYVGGPLSKAFSKANAAKAKLYYRSRTP